MNNHIYSFDTNFQDTDVNPSRRTYNEFPGKHCLFELIFLVDRMIITAKKFWEHPPKIDFSPVTFYKPN